MNGKLTQRRPSEGRARTGRAELRSQVADGRTPPGPVQRLRHAIARMALEVDQVPPVRVLDDLRAIGVRADVWRPQGRRELPMKQVRALRHADASAALGWPVGLARAEEHPPLPLGLVEEHEGVAEIGRDIELVVTAHDRIAGMLGPLIQVRAGGQADVLAARVEEVILAAMLHDAARRPAKRSRRTLLPMHQIAADEMAELRHPHAEQVPDAILEEGKRVPERAVLGQEERVRCGGERGPGRRLGGRSHWKARHRRQGGDEESCAASCRPGSHGDSGFAPGRSLSLALRQN